MSDTKLFTVDKFLGLNEAADGRTELKMGEASRTVNWFVTDGFNITVRPGVQRLDFKRRRTPAPVLASWSGFIGGTEYIVLVDFDAQDRIFLYRHDSTFTLERIAIGKLGLTQQEDAFVKCFSFGGKFFVMSAKNTVMYEGNDFIPARIYVPTVVTGAAPAGGGASLEGINLLTPYRKIEFSADGEATAYVLPEEAAEVTKVVVDNVETADAGTFDAPSHTFNFRSPPVKGVANVEFTYGTDAEAFETGRMEVVRKMLHETYNGATDTRLFLAGDGTNVCIYSGVPRSGDLTELYFPAMNQAEVDMSGSPITGLVRHFSKLMVFKPDGAFTLAYQPITLPGGEVIASFQTRSVNKGIGSDLFGQIQTVDNHPRTIANGAIYDWIITNSSYLDERYAKRVSDKVERTLQRANYEKIVTCEDSAHQTYYVFLNDTNGTVLVNRYGLTKEGVWCVYRSERFTHVSMAYVVGGDVAFISGDELFTLAEDTRSDAPGVFGGEPIPIEATWESGYMDFGADFLRKYSSQIYVSAQPEASSTILVSAETDRRPGYAEREITSNVFSWSTVTFKNWVFDINSTPRIQKLKLKVKKFVYYKLIFKNAPGANATILGYDQSVRFGSYAK